MTSAALTQATSDTSPKTKARTAGAFYLLTLVTAAIAEGYIGKSLIVHGDANATAANILAHPALLGLAFTVYMIEMTCQITMTALFYELLRPAGKSVAMLGAVLSYVGCTIKTFSRLFFFAPLYILGDAQYLRVFTGDQLKALSLLFLEVNDHGAAIAMIFFGLFALLKGYLILRSTFLPRALGVLTMLGGFGWLAFLSPDLGYRLFAYIAPVALLGSIATIVWLLVFGVNEQRWQEQSSAAAASIWR